MSTEPDTLPGPLVDPRTGEMLPLDADTGTLAGWVDQLADLERHAREVRARIGEELLHRLDRSAKWTHHLDGFTVTAPSPAPVVEWDAVALRATLRDLEDEGVIDEEAVQAALEVVITYKARTAGLNALRKLGSDVAERIAACGHEVERRRTVKVKRS